MADSNNCPQLPRNVWRGVWNILRKTPKRKLDDKALAAELGVQPTAAKAYSRELIKLGILSEDLTPTDLANRWRQDGNDDGVIEDIMQLAYPQDLRDLAPRDGLDRDKIIRWFMNEGLGEGSAKNKAATYIMVASGVSDEAESSTSPPKRQPSKPRTPKITKGQNGVPPSGSGSGENGGSGGRGQSRPDLNVNIQIHISADASSEQIDAIFSSMKRYFNESD
jgi:hypothetical protein